MEDYNDDSLLLDGVEDEYISVRETPSLRASKLTDEFIKSDTDWNYRSKRLFNMKLRRYGRRSPEMLNPVDGTSLANITERLTHLARIRSCTYDTSCITDFRCLSRLPHTGESQNLNILNINCI